MSLTLQPIASMGTCHKQQAKCDSQDLHNLHLRPDRRQGQRRQAQSTMSYSVDTKPSPSPSRFFFTFPGTRLLSLSPRQPQHILALIEGLGRVFRDDVPDTERVLLPAHPLRGHPLSSTATRTRSRRRRPARSAQRGKLDPLQRTARRCRRWRGRSRVPAVLLRHAPVRPSGTRRRRRVRPAPRAFARRRRAAAPARRGREGVRAVSLRRVVVRRGAQLVVRVSAVCRRGRVRARGLRLRRRRRRA